MTAPEKTSGSRWRLELSRNLRGLDPMAVGLILVIFLTEAVIGVLLLSVASQFAFTALGLTDRQGASLAGLALAAYGAAKMPGQPLSGWLADRFQPRIVLITGIALALPVEAVWAATRSAGVFIGACALIGLALSVVWPAVYAIVGQRFASSMQGRLLALVSMGQIAGTALGFVAGAVLIDHVSYSSAFLVALILDGAALLLTFLVVRDGSKDRPPEKAQTGGLAPSVVQRGAFRALLNPTVALLVFLIMLLSVGVAMLQPDLKPYSDEVLHLSFSAFGFVLIAPGLTAAVLLVPSGYVADRLGRVIPMVVGLGLFGTSLLLITATTSPLVAAVIASFAAAGYVFSLPALSASLLDVSNAGNRGVLTGMSTSIQAIGLVAGPLIGGRLVHSFGPLAPFRAAAVIVLSGAALSVLYGARVRGDLRRAMDSALPETSA